MASRTEEGRDTLEPEPEAAAASSDPETTNQRTELPILAADTAATSPTPPGGDTTMIFLEASDDDADDMDREEEEEGIRVVADGTTKASAADRAIAEAISANATGTYMEYMIYKYIN